VDDLINAHSLNNRMGVDSLTDIFTITKFNLVNVEDNVQVKYILSKNGEPLWHKKLCNVLGS